MLHTTHLGTDSSSIEIPEQIPLGIVYYITSKPHTSVLRYRPLAVGVTVGVVSVTAAMLEYEWGMCQWGKCTESVFVAHLLKIQ